MDDINWVGFYLYKDAQLVLGSFQGRAAVTRIDIGNGVCGTAFEKGEAVTVPDVHSFPGQIACDLRSRSEIAVPLRCKGSVIGVLDIDSSILSRFDETDRSYLERAVNILCEASEF